MISIEVLTTFFGWCVVINFLILALGAFVHIIFRQDLARIVAKLFGVSTEEANNTFFHLIQQYRLLLIVFSVVPYLVLKAMGF